MRLRVWVLVALSLAGIALSPGAEAAGRQLSAERLYEQAAPAVPYVETAIAGGSGILFEGGYVLTDSHVVWPYDTATVRFPGGREYRDAPVVAQDILADLAVIRVGEVPGVTPLRFADAARTPIGSDVYLVGYPAERQPNPVPTLSRGLLSRLRTGGPLRLLFAQTDAVSAGGASGGPMLNEAGEVVGITQLRFPSTDFLLALSGAQALERVQGLLRGAQGELGSRQYSGIPARPVAGELVELATPYEQRAYLIRTLSDVDVTVRATGTEALLAVYTPSGARAARSSSVGERFVRFRAVAGHPYVLVASAARGTAFELSADHPIVRIPDPDDGRAVTPGGFTMGNLDYYTDVDVFTIDLREGQTVTVTAESTLTDIVVLVQRADDVDGPVLDSSETQMERGILGNDAILSFTAAADRRYRVVVLDYGLLFGPRPGAYRLSVFPSQPSRAAEGFGEITAGDVPGPVPAPLVFGGGSDDDLVAASGCSRADLRLWAADGLGGFVAFIPGALVTEVNAAWSARFPFGVPAGTALIGHCPRS